MNIERVKWVKCWQIIQLRRSWKNTLFCHILIDPWIDGPYNFWVFFHFEECLYFRSLPISKLKHPQFANPHFTGLHQEGAYTYSGISCHGCVHQFFYLCILCILSALHIMHEQTTKELVCAFRTGKWSQVSIFWEYHWCAGLFMCNTVHINRYNVKSHWKVQGRNSSPE